MSLLHATPESEAATAKLVIEGLFVLGVFFLLMVIMHSRGQFRAPTTGKDAILGASVLVVVFVLVVFVIRGCY